MQLSETSFSDSAIFIEKKTVKNRLWAESDFCGQKEFTHFPYLLLVTCYSMTNKTFFSMEANL